jgi:hypothetical protein
MKYNGKPTIQIIIDSVQCFGSFVFLSMALQLTPQIADTMFPSDSKYVLYGWKKGVFAVIKRKKEECIFVWRIVVAAEKMKGRFIYV